MQRREPSTLSGESAPMFVRRMGPVAPTSGRAPESSGRARLPDPRTRGPAQEIPARQAPADSARAVTPVATAVPTATGTDTAIPQELRTPVNLDSYFLGVLGQFKEDGVVLNPMNRSTTPESAPQHVVAAPSLTEAFPIGHSAISNTRIFLDSLILGSSYKGYADGEIPFQFSDQLGLTPPDHVVIISITPFRFPHIYTAGGIAFDFFYFQTLFVTVQFIPSTNLVHPGQPNRPFTFECALNAVNGSVDLATPFDPIFSLRQPINAGNLSIKFQTRAPSGGFINCPIPPTRITVIRTLFPPGGPTTFTISDGTYIGALAPPGAMFSVPILFQRKSDAAYAPPTGLQALLYTSSGFVASTFTASGTFTIPIDTSMWLGPPPAPTSVLVEEHYIFVPKNGIAMGMRFACLSASKTNDLIPIFQ